ncbi:MAG: 50S ribosomal protein L11 methyltransferase [Paludibacteraceae bacterium]|nr:50S ribosomal protein L11 methyltransferase [Paludibacteraceae bacterium]
MRYHVLHIETRFGEEWQKDLFDQQLCDLGVDTIDGGDYYIPSTVWETQMANLTSQISNTEGAELLSVEACPDENWNAAWEAEHPIQELPMGVRIIPHCAFGAGHHETTGMLIDALMTRDLSGQTVLDNGCGTGVLGIMAMRRGAQRVIAVDIDDKSVENTRENAALNQVTIDARLGDTPPEGQYDLILSNIHRNILILQMPLYARYLRPGGEVWISGFLAEDCPPLIEAAAGVGLRFVQKNSREAWQMIQFRSQ